MTRSSAPRHQDGTYDIRLRGELDPHWAARFGVSGQLVHEAGGVTLLRGVAADPAIVHGVLQRIRDLGVPILSLTHVPAKTQ
jgi:hypothetical protein